MLHETRGITDTVRALADGLAAEGWLVVVPHIYRGAHESGVVDESVGPVVLDCSTATVLEVLDSAATDPVGASVSTAGVATDEPMLTGVAAGRLSVDAPHAVAM